MLSIVKVYLKDDEDWKVKSREVEKSLDRILAGYNSKLSLCQIWVFLAPLKILSPNNYYYLNMFGMWNTEKPPKFIRFKHVDNFTNKIGTNYVLFWVKVRHKQQLYTLNIIRYLYFKLPSISKIC